VISDEEIKESEKDFNNDQGDDIPFNPQATA
jgi:hypothetical protein